VKPALAVAGWLARALFIVLLVVAGSTLLVRFAPGYLSDAREMDVRYSSAVRAELTVEAIRTKSYFGLVAAETSGWARGDAGISRQFGVPVTELLAPRMSVTGGLLLKSLLLAWAAAIAAAIAASAPRKPSWLWQVPVAILLALPAAAMATLCLMSDSGGPALVLALLIAARDFKFLCQALRKVWLDPCILQARAQGVALHRMLRWHLLPAIAPQLGPLASLSIVTALSAIVPVEVLFHVPGLGQLAWNAAMNRDLPVLLAITALMALAVMCAGLGRSRADDSMEWKDA